MHGEWTAIEAASNASKRFQIIVKTGFKVVQSIENYIVAVADFLCGYPLFFLLIGGGVYLFVSSGAVSLRRIPHSINCLRERPGKSAGTENAEGSGRISSLQALLGAVAGTVGLGSIAGVAIALVMGGPGAIFWMWVSAIVGMCTKYHEGALSIMYRGKDEKGAYRGGMMYIIHKGLGEKWRPLAKFFAIAGLFGTLCIINANQLTEALMSKFTTPQGLSSSALLNGLGNITGMGAEASLKLIIGLSISLIVAVVVLRGIRSIARVSAVLVPVMVGVYFLMVLYIIFTNLHAVPGVFLSIFGEAFSLRAGIGALAGVAIIGARRAALVNDAGIGTASMMHGSSNNTRPVREGLIAMLGPAIDSGLVCTLTAVALLIGADFSSVSHGLKGLEIALQAFARTIPAGDYLLLAIVTCFALSSMFSYSYYGTACAEYLMGKRKARMYTWVYIASLTVFAVVPLSIAVSMCDLFYACMAFPAMCTILALSPRVRAETRKYFSQLSPKSND